MNAHSRETRADQKGGSAAALVGFAESFSSPEVAWSLADAGIRPVLLARRGSNTAVRFSRYAEIADVTPPESDFAQCVAEVESKARDIAALHGGQQVFLCLDDVSVLIAARAQWPSGIVAVGVNRASLALDKGAQLRLAHSVGFRVPRTIIVEAANELDRGAIKLPVVVKPAHAVFLQGGRVVKGHFAICYTGEELERAIKFSSQFGPFLVQEYLAGTGEGLFGIASSGSVSHWSAHRRIRMMNPVGSGASACISVAPSEAEMRVAREFLSSAQWNGPFMIELLRDTNGQVWFMELNGRLWGSTALARRCGIEYPALAVESTGAICPLASHAVSAKTGVVCRHAGREILHGLFVLRGRRPASHLTWPGRWNTICSLLRVRGSDHWYNWRKDDWRVFVHDIWCTMSSVVRKPRFTTPA